MLLLSRKVGEKVVLPSCSVTVAVVAVSGNRVRLGITAPADIPIHRDEVARRSRRSSEIGSGEGNAISEPLQIVVGNGNRFE
jgi:carbon storage regulator